MTTALLVEYYRALPERQEEDSETWLTDFQGSLGKFKKKVSRRYTEGTLLRLLQRPEAEVRQAAVLALGMLGTMCCNRLLARRLHDTDDKARLLASNALWAVSFRADSEDNNQELQRLARLRDRGKALAGLNALIDRAPRSPAYNQRAILFYQAKLYERAISDCETVLALNPYHFGAQVGLAQCLMQLRRHKAALRPFARRCGYIRSWRALRKPSAPWSRPSARKAAATTRSSPAAAPGSFLQRPAARGVRRAMALPVFLRQWQTAVQALAEAKRDDRNGAVRGRSRRRAWPAGGTGRQPGHGAATAAQLWHQGGNRGRRLRVGLALLPTEPDSVRDELAQWMLEIADPTEVLLREQLVGQGPALTDKLWHTAEDARGKPARYASGRWWPWPASIRTVLAGKRPGRRKLSRPLFRS